MTAAQIEVLPDRMAEGMLGAYYRRKRFEAQLIANQVWSAVRKKPAEAGGEDATDAELSEFMELE